MSADRAAVLLQQIIKQPVAAAVGMAAVQAERVLVGMIAEIPLTVAEVAEAVPHILPRVPSAP